MSLQNWVEDAVTESGFKSNDPGVGFDWSILIDLLLDALMTMLENCRKKPTFDQIQSPNILQKWALRRALGKACRGDADVERRYVGSLVRGTLAKAAKTSEAEFDAVVGELAQRVGISG